MLAMWDDLLGHFNEMGFSWNFWAFKDLGAMGLVAPRPDTPWRVFLDKPEVRAIREAGQRCLETFQSATRERAPFVDQEEVKVLILGARHHWDALALPKVLELLKPYSLRELEEMAGSFRFSSCAPHEGKVAVVRRRAAEAGRI